MSSIWIPSIFCFFLLTATAASKGSKPCSHTTQGVEVTPVRIPSCELCFKTVLHSCVYVLNRFSSVPLLAFYRPTGPSSLLGSSVHRILQARILSGLPCLPPGDLPHLGIKPISFMSPALAGKSFTTRATWEAPFITGKIITIIIIDHYLLISELFTFILFNFH